MLSSPLLTTKLYRPPIDCNWIARPALFTRLNNGLTRKLTLVSAPPGFGKSTLISQWLARFDSDALSASPACQISKSCWLSLDEGDNHLAHFLRYLIASVQRCEPTACPTTQSLLTASQLPSVDYLADVVVSELSSLADELILVLDDYHVIHTDEVHQLMRYLIQYMPPRLHLTILSRTDPPLHLARLRISQQISELRAADLRFTAAETRQFMERRLAQSLDEKALRLLHGRTEGWITALQLSSITLQHQDPQQFLANFRGNNQMLVGYLIEEVMARLDAPLRDFLLRTAIVDRFCASLAAALWAEPMPTHSQAMMGQLQAYNLFIIPLDEHGEWVRYHDLFRDFLRHQLTQTVSPENLAALHKAASTWYAGRELIEEALRHALAAGDETAAVELFITQFHPMLDQKPPGPTLARWLSLFAEETIQAHPELLVAQCWMSALGLGPQVQTARLADIETQIQADHALSSARRHALLADLASLRGVWTYWSGDSHQAIEVLQSALAQQAPTHVFTRAQILFHLAFAYSCSGKPDVGDTLLRTALAEEKAQQHPTLIILLGGLAILRLYRGELADVAYWAQQAVSAVDEAANLTDWQEIGYVNMWYGWAHYLLGIVQYEQNDLAAAARHWQRVENLRYRTNPATYQGSLFGLALIALVNGASAEAARDEQAMAYAQTAHEFVAEIRRPDLVAISDSFEVLLALRIGDRQDLYLRLRLQEINTGSNQGMMFGVELPFLTRLRALLAIDKPDALMEALTFSETCLYQAKRAHNITQTIQISVLQALILYGLRRTEEACNVLAQVLPLASTGNFMRTFLDLGAPLAKLLRAYVAQHGASDYLNSLLAAFTQEYGSLQPIDLAAQYAQRYGITPLTPRELEVLVLVNQRLTQAEIANTLVISVGTVKNHTHNIYSKLGVRNGRQAVSKARTVGILPPM